VRFEQRARRFQPARRIVVAGDDDDLQLRRARLRPLQEAVQLALGGGRWVGVVEDVARDQERVGLFTATMVSSSQSRKHWCS
jgi:hypothetical protein